MAFSKTLWVVNYDKLADFVADAVAAKVTGVAIRTDNDLDAAIQAFHARNIKVFGWRWPSAKEDAAMKEAAKVVGLLGRGLDGYYVDPEGEPGKPYDWDRPGLGPLASKFSKAITDAAHGKPYGVTSHYRAKAQHKNLPWAQFFEHATVLLPQAYWRVEGGVVGHGDPADNYRQSIKFWKAAGGKQDRIAPMAGEIAFAKPAELKAYAKEATANGVADLHFYTATETIKPATWAAIAAL
jgi:hypothetical protein